MDAFEQLVDYEVGEVTAAATYYLGEIYIGLQPLAASSRSVRPGSRGRGAADYELALEEEAFPFEEKAIKVHEKNLELMRGGDLQRLDRQEPGAARGADARSLCEGGAQQRLPRLDRPLRVLTPAGSAIRIGGSRRRRSCRRRRPSSAECAGSGGDRLRGALLTLARAFDCAARVQRRGAARPARCAKAPALAAKRPPQVEIVSRTRRGFTIIEEVRVSSDVRADYDQRAAPASSSSSTSRASRCSSR